MDQPTLNKTLISESELPSNDKDLEVSKHIQSKVKQAICLVGNQHRYQLAVMVIIGIVFLQVCFLLLGGSYLYMNPNFICNGVATRQQQACRKLSECYLENTYTITAKAQLYCQGQNERNTIQAMYGLGAFVGVIFINMISDLKGRKFAMLTAVLVGLLANIVGVIGVYGKMSWLFIVSQLMAGFCAQGCLNIVLVFADKLMSDKWRIRSFPIANIFFAFGQTSIILFTNYMDWLHYSVIFGVLLSSFIFIICTLVLVEDPVILFTNKKPQKCRQSIQKIAKLNGKTKFLRQAMKIIDDLEYKNIQLQSSQSQQKPSFIQSLKKYRVLKNWNEVLKPLILFACLSFSSNIAYYIQNFQGNGTGLSYGVNMTFYGVAQGVATFPLIWLGDKIKRRQSSIFVVSFTVAFGLLFLFDISPTLETIANVFIRGLGNTAYAIYGIFIVQTFPQHIQSTCLGLIQFIGKVAPIVSPFLVRFADTLGIPSILIASAGYLLLNILPLLFLKETLNVKAKIGLNLKNQDQQSQQNI